MKTRTLFQLLGIVFGICVVASTALARLPVPYEHEGVIATVDCQAHSITLEPPKPKFRLGRTVKPSSFVWTDKTRFIKKGQPSDATSLSSGAHVRVYYRYETKKSPPILVKAVLADESKSEKK